MLSDVVQRGAVPHAESADIVQVTCRAEELNPNLHDVRQLTPCDVGLALGDPTYQDFLLIL